MLRLATFLSHWKSQVTWFISSIVLLTIVVNFSPSGRLPFHLPAHILLEALSVTIAFMIFHLGRNTYDPKHQGNLYLVSLLFLSIGLLDLAHMMSYDGMPVFFTLNNPHKAIIFWQFARAITAITLLVFTVTYVNPIQSDKFSVRLLYFIGCSAAALLLIAVIIKYDYLWPATFVKGEGLTPFKIYVEYGILSIHILNLCWIIVNDYRKPDKLAIFNSKQMASALVLLIVSEYSFTLYSKVNDSINMIGHVFKIVGFVFVYKAIFHEGVHQPIVQLFRSERQLQHDLFQMREERDAVVKQNVLNAKVFESIREGIMVTDASQEIVFINRAFSELTGYTWQDAVGKSPRILSSGWHKPDYYNTMWNSIRTTGSWRGEIWNKKKDESLYLEEISITRVEDADGQVTHYVGVFQDVTLRKELEAKIHHQAFHDNLTGLPNRVLFQERLNQAIRHAQTSGRNIGVLFIDLDNFKHINDDLGHHIGDKLLTLTAERLKKTLRVGDTISRIGGDEMIVLLPEVQNRDDCARIAKKLNDVVAETYSIEGNELNISCSIGISMYPDDSTDADTLVKLADNALYNVKNSGRNHYQFYHT